jgi:hypothetical protein
MELNSAVLLTTSLQKQASKKVTTSLPPSLLSLAMPTLAKSQKDNQQVDHPRVTGLRLWPFFCSESTFDLSPLPH